MAVVPCGCPAQGPLDKAARAVIRRRYGLPADGLLVGSFGIASPAKLVVELLTAFRALSRINPGATLVFAGHAVMDLDEWAVRFGVADRVHTLGRVPLEDFQSLAGAVDIGVNLRRPPTNGETSASLLTLLGAGTPTLVTDIDSFAGYPDNVVVKVPWSDAFIEALTRDLLDLAEDRGRRARIGRAAVRHVHKRHDWSAVAEQYADVIMRAAQRNEAPNPLTLEEDGETTRQGDSETARWGDKEMGSVSLSPCLPVSLSPCLPVFPRGVGQLSLLELNSQSLGVKDVVR